VPTVRANGIDIYYERRGTGPRLLYFQGSGQTLAKSGVMVDGFAKEFEVVAYDQRGLGMTEIPPGPYEMSDYAADAAALLDTLGWESCRAVGTSFGGMVAQEFAVTWPERVERLALVCTSPGGAFASYPLHTLADLPPEEAKALGPKLLDGRFTPEYLAEHDDARALVEMITTMQGAPVDDETRRGELAPSTCWIASSGSPARRSSRPAGTTTSRRPRMRRRSRRWSRTRTCASTRAATSSSCRIRRRSPTSWSSSPPSERRTGDHLSGSTTGCDSHRA
jgi:pimeloyl-ACP methyl ester carboxylesterase